MKEDRFEELWQHLEAQKYGQKLTAGFPEWKRARQRAVRIATMLILVVVATVVTWTITTQNRTSRNFEKVYCNRVGTSDAQWVDLASEMLLE